MDYQNKYEIEEGRFVSRQRVYQLRHPEKLREFQKRYYENNREKLKANVQAWQAKFKEEHGMSYYMWRKYHEDNNDSV